MSERNPARFNTGHKASEWTAEDVAREKANAEAAEEARYEASFNEADYNDAMASRESEALMATEGRIMENVAAKRMYMIAQQAAELRANGGEPEILVDKENRLQELLEAYTNAAESERNDAFRLAEMERDTVKGQGIRAEKEAAAEAELAKRMEEVEFIINSTDPTWVSEKVEGVSATTEAEKLRASSRVDTNLDDDDAEKLESASRVDTNLDDDDEEERKKLAELNPVDTNLDDDDKKEEKRDGEETYLSKEDALKEAYDEYEKAEGAPYDVDKDRLSEEDALKVAYDEYETREGAPYDVDKGREKDVEKAREMALAEDQDRTFGTVEEVWDEAHEENDRRNAPKVKWWKNPGAYFGGLFTVGKEAGMDKWRGSRRSTKIALGAVGIVLAIAAAKAGYDWLSGPDVDPNSLPDGSGTPTPEATDPTVPTPETPKPEVPQNNPAEVFSDAARTVKPNEGMFQTFLDMNIPQDEWQGLMEKSGPELAEKGWTYQMPNGEWGWSRPGTLPQDMLELIQNNRNQ